ncbi:MAG: DegV family protein [Anaerolineae bacterium]
MSIALVTDSSTNLSAETIERFGIHLIPILLTIDVEVVREHYDVTPEMYYQRLVLALDHPTTNQPSVDTFIEMYTRLRARYDTIISVHVSSLLSGTVASAQRAARSVEDVDIHVIDSLNMSYAAGLLVHEAARLIASGEHSVEQIVARLQRMRDGLHLYVMLDDLAFLERSGRIGRVVRVVGSLLDAKPVITIKQGGLDIYERVRSRQAGIDLLRTLAVQGTQGSSGAHLAVAHFRAAEEADDLLTDLAATINPVICLSGEIAPSLITHSGPGTVGVAWWRGD